MIYTYFWAFFIFSFVGWVSQVLFAMVRDRRYVNRGFLNLPFCPVYGLSAVLIHFLLLPFRNLTVILIASWVIGTGMELMTGLLLEKIFRQKWWDYSDLPHNFRGYVCLKFSVLWAAMGGFVCMAGMPAVGWLVERIPYSVGSVVLMVLGGLLVLDFGVTVWEITSLNRKLRELEYVSRLIQESDKDAGGQAISQEALRLKEKYEANLSANRLHRRLLQAFPHLQSLRYNKELEELRRSIDEFRWKSSEALRRRNEAAIAVYERPKLPRRERCFAYGLCYSKMFWIFMIGNVVGCALETVYALLVPPHQFEIRVSVVIGPFILVYGFGAVLITLCLYRLYHQKDVLIFLASMVIGAAFEYVCSFAQQAMFGTVSWEYSDSPLNIGGRTNLMYAFFWGVLGLLWVKDMYPALCRLVERIPKRLGAILTAVVTVFMIFNMALSAGAVLRQSERINRVPATGPVREFFDRNFPDDYLEIIYPHMQYVGKPQLPLPSPDAEIKN